MNGSLKFWMINVIVSFIVLVITAILLLNKLIIPAGLVFALLMVFIMVRVKYFGGNIDGLAGYTREDMKRMKKERKMYDRMQEERKQSQSQSRSQK